MRFWRQDRGPKTALFYVGTAFGTECERGAPKSHQTIRLSHEIDLSAKVVENSTFLRRRNVPYLRILWRLCRSAAFLRNYMYTAWIFTTAPPYAPPVARMNGLEANIIECTKNDISFRAA